MRRTVFCASLCLFAAGLHVKGADWKPISAEEMALKQPKVDPKADAEVLLWDISVADEATNNQYPETVYRYYVRLKVFTERGAKTFQVPDIEYSKNQHVSDVAGHTVQPDGSVQEVGKDGILEHLLGKRKGVKDRAVSLAMPNVKPGTIIEYRWRETHDGELADNVALPGAREIPVEHLVYHIRPLQSPYFPYSMRYNTFNMNLPPFKDGPDHMFISSVDNVPAFAEEPDSPPELDMKPWVLIFYMEDSKVKPDDYWKKEGKRSYAYFHSQIKVNGDVKAIANEVAGSGKTPEEQIRLLYVYCQKHIKNLSGPDVSDTERQKNKDNHSSVDTLKRAAGFPLDIQLAFAALVNAMGLEARPALVSCREIKFFDKAMANRYFLPQIDIAVQIGDSWKLYDVTNRHVAPGQLPWHEEGVPALITDDKNPEWITTPVTDAAHSRTARIGSFKLDESGTLEGDIAVTYEGHEAAEWRAQNIDRSTGQRDDEFKKELNARFGGAEITQLLLPDPAETTGFVTARCHIKVEGYATRTGKRLIFAPAFFEMNEGPRYAPSERRNPVYFRYGWSEVDDVRVDIPSGFTLDHPDAPGGFDLTPFMKYTVKIAAGKHYITYHRELAACDKFVAPVPKEKYSGIKRVFDVIHDSDGHLLTLKADPAAQPQQPGN